MLDLKNFILHTRFRITRSILGSLGPTVVRIGWNQVIKGPCDPPELEALLYISEHTTLPVPRVRHTYNGPGGIYVKMDYIRDADLETLWIEGRLSPGEKESIVDDMAIILTQLRALHPPKDGIVASVQGGPFLDYRIGSQLVGPFESHSSFHSFLRGGAPLENTATIFGEKSRILP